MLHVYSPSYYYLCWERSRNIKQKEMHFNLKYFPQLLFAYNENNGSLSDFNTDIWQENAYIIPKQTIECYLLRYPTKYFLHPKKFWESRITYACHTFEWQMTFITVGEKKDLELWLIKYCNIQILYFKMGMLTFLHLCKINVIFKLSFLIFFTFFFFSLIPQLCSQFNQIILVLFSFVVICLLILYQNG